ALPISPMPAETPVPTEMPTATATSMPEPTETPVPLAAIIEGLINEALNSGDESFDASEVFGEDVTPEEIIEVADEIENIDLDITSEGTAEPGEELSFVINFGNDDDSTLEQVVIIMVVPDGTVFISNGSGSVPPAGVHAAAAMQGADAVWQLVDGSGPCPDGAPAGTVCAMRIGNLSTGDAGQVVFNTQVNNDVESGTDIAVNGRLDAANIANAQVLRLTDEAMVNVQVPTALDAIDEPNQPRRWFSFLPFIGR
ncbi:MAG: hypothetical protein AAF637_15780, partial [Pseudomonadota bacterium]